MGKKLSFYSHLKNNSDFLFRIVLIFTVILYCLLTIIHVFYPYNGDQALFNLFAESINNKGILYKDFWDIKQPGIFYFYYLAGKAFSFTEEGIHLFEAFYWLLFSIIIFAHFRKSRLLNNNYLDFLLPLFTVGSYYIMAGNSDLTQVEILVSLPLAFCIFLMNYYLKTNKVLPYFILGILLSIVLFYKLLFLLIIGGLVLINLIEIIRLPKMKLKFLFLKKLLPAIVGFSVLPVIFIIYSIHNGVLEKEVYTFFILPQKLITRMPNLKGADFFISAGLKFIKEFLPLFILMLPGVFLHSPNQRPLVIKLIIWLVGGAIVIFMQKTSYWHYQYQLLIFPLGILSVIGIDRLLYKFTKYKIIIICLCFAISLPFSYSALKKTWFFYRYNPLNSESRLQYKNLYLGNYLAIKEDARFIENIDRNQKVYICGNPLYYFFTKRSQPVSLNGWALEFYLKEQYIDLVGQLNTVLPEFIFISTDYVNSMPDNALVLKTFIDNHYSLYKKNELGIWLERRKNGIDNTLK